MADNPNKSSAKPSGGDAPRRSGTPSNPRLMDFSENDFRRFRTQTYQPARTSGRNRSDRPQSSGNNRIRLDRPPGIGHGRIRTDRLPTLRDFTDRPNNGNYSERVYYSSTVNHKYCPLGIDLEEINRTRPTRATHLSEQRQSEDNYADVFHNGGTYISDTNRVDQETSTFAKRNHTTEHSSNSANSVNGEASKRSVVQFSFPRYSSSSGELINNGIQNSTSERREESDLVSSGQRFRLGGSRFDESNTRIPYMASLPTLTDLPIYDSPTSLPEVAFDVSQPRHSIRDSFRAPLLNATNSNRNPVNNLPRPIKGRFSPVSSATVGLPRPITKQDLTSTNNSEAAPDLPHTVTSGALHEEWANAPEFVPKGSKPKSYAEVVTPKTGEANGESPEKRLCPYAERAGECRMPPGCCPYLHGDLCDLCARAALHPTDNNQRKQHHEKCVARHEKEMEISFAVARSRDKTCGICFEVILEKQVHERRFGILTQCNHCFCLGCIRKWRQARQFENKVVRACPECRVTSDFVCPSVYWVETKEEKDKLIENYKNALAEKQCKYFKQGRGSCPFGNKCFYLHALPDGTKTDVGPPPRRRRHNRNRYPDDGELGDMLQQIILWDFLDEHDHHWLYSFADDIEELVAFFSDSDESEWSDYEFLLD